MYKSTTYCELLTIWPELALNLLNLPQIVSFMLSANKQLDGDLEIQRICGKLQQHNKEEYHLYSRSFLKDQALHSNSKKDSTHPSEEEEQSQCTALVESNMTPCEVCCKQVYLKKTSGNSDLISAQRRHEVSSDGRVIRRERGLQTQQTWCSCGSSSTCFTRRSQPETASGSQQLLFKDSVSFGVVSCYTKMTGAEKHAGSCSSEQKTDPFIRRFSVTTQSGAFSYLMV